MLNRIMTIEAALKWAYRDELVKTPSDGRLGVFAPPSIWSSVERYGELGTIIDAARNRYGMVPDVSGEGEPHPFAVMIHEAVEALSQESVLPEGWNPLEDIEPWPEVPGLIAKGLARVIRTDGTKGLIERPAEMIRRCVILGAYDTYAGEVERRVVTEQGREKWFRETTISVGEQESARPYVIEVDGYNHKAKRPYDDAYRRYVIEPDLAGVVEDRARYEIWRSALDVLAEECDGLIMRDKATGHVVETLTIRPCALPRRPWMGGEARARVGVHALNVSDRLDVRQ